MGRPNKFDGMMHELIAGLGWDCRCFKNGKPLFVNDFIPETGTVSADQFARCVIMAEGLDPQPKKYRRRIPELKAVFVKHMGADVVDASKLRSGIDDE
jgi:hypothetical protein